MDAALAGTTVRARPHTKTHKVPNIALMQIARGAIGVCCAKVGEAEVFAAAGIEDIRLPYPVQPSNADRVLALLDPDEIIVFGVATDVCDDAAIRGFLARGRRVLFVEDAARGLDEGRVGVCTAAWRDGGVEFATADAVVRSLL
jgi:D-serine deaminase-like pyridoxal phosphate-dependent protein